MSRATRIAIARKRLPNILEAHGIALARTIEQKIAVGGPYNQRVNPHIITEARNGLIEEGTIVALIVNNVRWYHLADTPDDVIQARLAEQEPIHDAVTHDAFTKRLGQTLEIAVQRALDTAPSLKYFGRFIDLADHDDSTLYKKEEPPSHLGSKALAGKQKLDFIICTDTGHWAGIEVKNTRPWIYPTQSELVELLRKCITLDIAPVLIARRIPYVTGFLFRRCGLVTWETLRQRYPMSENELADAARHKSILGFSDISLGNEPDGPLSNFASTNLPKVLPEARERFEKYKDLLEAFSFGEMPYHEFAARVRRRSEGKNEDFDDEPPEDWLEPP